MNDGIAFNHEKPSFDEGRELLCAIVEKHSDGGQRMAGLGPKTEEDKGIFDTIFDTAKDIGKMTTEKVSQAGKAIASGTSEMGKMVAEKTKNAANKVWEKSQSITVFY
jgi:hypothetical protein